MAEKTPIRVLHVDDDAFSKATKQSLEMEGLFHVETASSVDKAMEKMKMIQFDVIASDYMMPGKDGLQFLKALGDQDNMVPFVIFTGKDREEVAIRALNMGADRYLNKTGNPETGNSELARSIHQAMETEKILGKTREISKNRYIQLALLMKRSAEVIKSSDLRQQLQTIAESVRELGWRRVIVSARDKDMEIPSREFMIVSGLTDEEEEFSWNNRPSGQVWRERFGSEYRRFKIGEFYYLPWSDPWVRKKFHDLVIPSKLQSEETVDWNPQDLLYAPLRLADGTIVGILALDDPLDGKRPTKESLEPLELFIHLAAIAIEKSQLTVARDRAQKELKVLVQKLRVVGRLSRHDIRNKLSVVTSNVYLAKHQLRDKDKALEYLDEVESGIGQVASILDFAAVYEKLGSEELAYMNVRNCVEETVQLFTDLKGLKVVNSCHGLVVFADSLIQRLFYNLIHNSLIHGDKVSEIRIYYKEFSKDKLKLVYEDDGVGIPKSEKEKIFRWGYGKGTGVGLYLIRKICEVYGWTIQETGKEGKGAQFTMTIPRVDGNKRVKYRFKQSGRQS